MHRLLCVCPPRVDPLFPLVLLKSCNQIPLAFKVWFSGNSSSCCLTARLGKLTWGSEPSFQWVDFCGIIVLKFVSHPTSGYGVWFYCDCAPYTISLWLLLCLWMCGVFFGEFQYLPVDDCSAVSGDSGALSRGSECTSFYSVILDKVFKTTHMIYSKPFKSYFNLMLSYIFYFFLNLSIVFVFMCILLFFGLNSALSRLGCIMDFQLALGLIIVLHWCATLSDLLLI